MTLALPGQWVWDSWFAFDGENHHIFYLQASKALQDPNRRHNNVSIGHAVSDDLTNWTVLPDALIYSDAPAIDDYTTWTGSVVRAEDGLWWMFYTARTRANGGLRQTVTAATSRDLITWEKVDNQKPLVAADKKWYKTIEEGSEHEPFRDPFVFKLPGEDQWTMLVTAASVDSKVRDDEGVMAIAKSSDLRKWELLAPLGKPGQGFGETEVFQFEVVDGVPIVLFCCGPWWISEERKARGEVGGIYSLPVAADLSDVDFNRSVLFEDTTLYASRLVQGKDGKWNLLAFINEVNGEFIGQICDPIPVTAHPEKGIIRR